MIVVHNTGLTGDTNNCNVSNTVVCSLCLMCNSTTFYVYYKCLTQVEIDRRMLDFCVGLDTEFSEVVEGSHLYFPKTRFEQVTTAYLLHM